MTDSEVIARLRGLTGFVRKLDIGRNSLTEIPALTKYREMDTLEELSLYKNKIEGIMWDNVPTQVQVLYLQYNQLQDLPILEQRQKCLQVRELWLHNNTIQSLQPGMIPGSVQKLYMDMNHLTKVGNISQLSLKVLDLSFNGLTEVIGQYLPASLTELRLDPNPLRQTVDLSHMVNLTRLSVPRSHCQEYRQMLPSTNIRC